MSKAKAKIGAAIMAASLIAAAPMEAAQKPDQEATRSTPSTPQNQGQRDQAQVIMQYVVDRDDRLGFQRAFRHSRPFIDLNQRQYRKRCRRNPWLYRSRKHRSKN